MREKTTHPEAQAGATTQNRIHRDVKGPVFGAYFPKNLISASPNKERRPSKDEKIDWDETLEERTPATSRYVSSIAVPEIEARTGKKNREE